MMEPAIAGTREADAFYWGDLQTALSVLTEVGVLRVINDYLEGQKASTFKSMEALRNVLGSDSQVLDFLNRCTQKAIVSKATRKELS